MPIDLKISQLPAGAAITGSEILPMDQAGSTVQNPISAIITKTNTLYDAAGAAAAAQAAAEAASDPVGSAATAQTNAEAYSSNAANLSSGTVQQARLQVFGAAQSGIVPLSGGGTTNFLRADGTWNAPPAGAVGANPTATMSTTVVNGVAGTFMRSDASPALPIASASVVGGVKGDGSTVSIAGDGTLSVPAGSSTQQGGVIVDNITIAVRGGKIATNLRHPGFAANRYYWGISLAPAGVTTGYVANTLYASAFYVPYPTVFTKASVYTGTNTGNVEIGIYNIANGVPTTLLYDCGSKALASGSVEITGLNLVLAGGMYALVCAFDGTPVIAYGNIATQDCEMFGDSSSYGGNVAVSWHGAWTFSAGNLPGTFPSPSFATSATVPLVFLRL